MITIRRAQHSDALQIETSHKRSIREVCNKDYTPEQIEAWAGRNIKESTWCQTIDRDYVWVVEKDGLVFGFGHLALMDQDIAEIMGLYFAPEIRGMGAGKKIFALILNEAVAQGIKKINLMSTLTAKTFYERFGLKPSGAQSSIDMRGIQVPSIPMEKATV